MLGDCLRVGFALKRDELLLKAAGMIEEAELMATMYDDLCSRSPEAYTGKRRPASEYRGIDMSPAITVDTLFELAVEDKRAANAASAGNPASAANPPSAANATSCRP